MTFACACATDPELLMVVSCARTPGSCARDLGSSAKGAAHSEAASGRVDVGPPRAASPPMAPFSSPPSARSCVSGVVAALAWCCVCGQFLMTQCTSSQSSESSARREIFLHRERASTDPCLSSVEPRASGREGEGGAALAGVGGASVVARSSLGAALARRWSRPSNLRERSASDRSGQAQEEGRSERADRGQGREAHGQRDVWSGSCAPFGWSSTRSASGCEAQVKVDCTGQPSGHPARTDGQSVACKQPTDCDRASERVHLVPCVRDTLLAHSR